MPIPGPELSVTMANAEFVLIPFPSACGGGSVRIAYHYNNLSNGISAMLYTCDGKISYQPKGYYTQYHGRVITDGPDPHSINLAFDCYGRENALKSTIVLKRAPGVYKGWDYAGREVIMTRKGHDLYCERCKAWHEMARS